MTFNELKIFMHSRGVSSLADIARELEVSPQSVSNWKSRGQVPYKYVVYIQNKYKMDNDSGLTQDTINIDNVYTRDIDDHEPKAKSTITKKKDDLSIIKDNEIDLLVLFQVLWNERKRIIQITAVVTFIGVLYALLVTPLYKSTITMYPSGQESVGKFSQLQGMASTFGFDVGGAEPSFHIPDIVNSRRLKTELIYHLWSSEKFEIPVSLIQYWEIDDTTFFNFNPISLIKQIFANDKPDFTFKWEEDALEEINNRISVKQEKSGLIKVEVLMEEPKIAADMANTMYPTIVDFTIEAHSNQAKLNREFIETRQEEVKEQLSAAEDGLKEFRQRNRSILESPQLQLEMERLLREVEIKTQVYITLQQQYELARIEEVKETPSVVILDEGKPAEKKDRPKRILIVIVAFLMGGVIGIVIILIPKYIIS